MNESEAVDGYGMMWFFTACPSVSRVYAFFLYLLPH